MLELVFPQISFVVGIHLSQYLSAPKQFGNLQATTVLLVVSATPKCVLNSYYHKWMIQ